MTKKLWYDEKGCNNEIWMPLKYWQDLCEDEGRDVILVEGCLDPKGAKYCKRYQAFDADCGISQCDQYMPCNEKSGKCIHLSRSLKVTGKEFLLKYTETSRVFDEDWGEDAVYGNANLLKL